MGEITEEIGALDRMAARERGVAELWRDGATDRAPRIMDEFLRLRSMQQRHFARGFRAVSFEAGRIICRREHHQRAGSRSPAARLEALCCRLALDTPAQRTIIAGHKRRLCGPTYGQLAARWGAAWEVPR